MKKIIHMCHNQSGVTFMEVMISVVIMTVVSAAVLQLYVTQHQNYLIQEDISNVQQNARASVDELSRHIRMAGYDLPLGLSAITAADADPDSITVTYKSRDCEVALTSDMGGTSDDMECGGAVDCFYAGQWVYIYHPDSGGGEWFQIGAVDEGGQLLTPSASLSSAYDADAIVTSVEQIKFFIDNTSDPDHPSLVVQPIGQGPQVYAEDLSDLQFQYRMKNGMVIDDPVVTDDIREVLISIQGRSQNAAPDPLSQGNAQHRYRNYATTVHLRNVGL